MHIYLGLCDDTKNGWPPLLLIIYCTNICNFLIFHSILIWFCGSLHDLIRTSISDSFAFNAGPLVEPLKPLETFNLVAIL